MDATGGVSCVQWDGDAGALGSSLGLEVLGVIKTETWWFSSVAWCSAPTAADLILFSCPPLPMTRCQRSHCLHSESPVWMDVCPWKMSPSWWFFYNKKTPSWAGKTSHLFNLIAMSFQVVLQNLPISLFSRIGNFYFPPCRWIKRVFSAPENPGQRATNTVFIPNSVHTRGERAVQADRATSPQPKSWKLMR